MSRASHLPSTVSLSLPRGDEVEPLQVDLDNTVPYLKYAKELGAYTVHWLIFSDSPVHTDELYVAKALEIIERADVDEIVIFSIWPKL